jgi:hypothetical protein
MYEASNPRRPLASWIVATPIGRNASTTAEGTLGMPVTTTAMPMLLIHAYVDVAGMTGTCRLSLVPIIHPHHCPLQLECRSVL